jgi:NADH:ubiquinone oxidoreductase subunit K
VIIAYLLLAAGLSIIEIKGMLKKKQTKDIFVFAGFMLAAAVIGVVYLLDTFRPSIAEFFLKIARVKG